MRYSRLCRSSTEYFEAIIVRANLVVVAVRKQLIGELD